MASRHVFVSALPRKERKKKSRCNRWRSYGQPGEVRIAFDFFFKISIYLVYMLFFNLLLNSGSFNLFITRIFMQYNRGG